MNNWECRGRLLAPLTVTKRFISSLMRLWQGRQQAPPTYLLFLFCCAPVFAFNAHQPFDISADVIEYFDETQEITAEGHVVVVQTSSTLTADFMRYDRLNNRLVARGRVILREKGNVMLGDQLDYDLVRETGLVLGGKRYGSPWLFQGASWEKIRDYYVGRRASFTSCDLIDPHYHIRSTRVHLIPDRFFWAWNNRFYTDRWPVFYSPFLYKSLTQRRVAFQLQYGEDGVKGAFAKTVTTLRITDRIYDKVYLDHYTVSGTGYGNEFNYQASDKYKGSLFAYYINPKVNPDLPAAPRAAQYNVRFYHWQKLSNYLTFQSNTNHRKNVSFNNQYFIQDLNQSVNDVQNSMALTHQKGRVNQTLATSALQGPDDGSNPLFGDLHVQSASLPSYAITLYQAPLWSPKTKPPEMLFSSGTVLSSTGTVLLSTRTLVVPKPSRWSPLQLSMSANANNAYSRRLDRVNTNADGSFSLSESLSLSRTLSLSQSVTPLARWQDIFGRGGSFRGYQGQIDSRTALGYRPFSGFNWDQGYTWRARLAPNAFRLDRSAPDGGVETHSVGSSIYWRPSREIQLRSSSGYDLRRFPDESLDAYRQRRISPWSFEMTLVPRRSSWDLFARHQLGYYPFRTLLWELSSRLSLPYRTNFSTALLYNRSERGRFTWNNAFGFYPSAGWRVDAVLNAVMPNTNLGSVREGTLLQSQFIVTRNMHCWEAQFISRYAPPFSREYSILFNLRFGPQSAKPIADQELEAQFYPWRAN